MHDLFVGVRDLVPLDREPLVSRVSERRIDKGLDGLERMGHPQEKGYQVLPDHALARCGKRIEKS